LDQYSYNKSHYRLSGVRIIHQTTVRWCSWLSRQSNIPVSITEGLQFKSGSNHFFVVSRGLGFGEKPSFCFWGISAATVTRLLRSQVPKLRGVQCSDAACVLVRPEYPLGLGAAVHRTWTGARYVIGYCGFVCCALRCITVGTDNGYHTVAASLRYGK
jgi:hypothetical protein